MQQNCYVCRKPVYSVRYNTIPMCKCSSCGIFYRESRKLPTGHYEKREPDLNPVKLKERKKNCLSRVELFKKIIDLNNFCDIGCGEGLFVEAMINSGFSDVWGVEICKEAVEYAERKKLPVAEGDIKKALNLVKKGYAKSVSLFHLLERLEDPKDTLDKIFESLPSGGYLIIETLDSGSYSLKASKFKHKLINPENFFYFSKKSIDIILKDSGFKIISSGTRDFNDGNLGISECLFRLGLKKYPSEIENNTSVIKNQKRKEISKYERMFRKFVGRGLNILVKIIDRSDYYWVIAQKP